MRVAAIAVLAACACAPNRSQDERARDSDIRRLAGDLRFRRDIVDWAVYHDDEREVTCWAVGGIREIGVSCIPDSQLSRARPERLNPAPQMDHK